MGWYYTFEAKEIQGFILQSDKLREMVGGSELVGQICGEFLHDALKAVDADPQTAIIASAAGWARLQFEHERQARDFAAAWPLLASRFAPGLKMVQALVPITSSLAEAMAEGIGLLRGARNCSDASLPEIGPLVERSGRTGGAAVVLKKERGDDAKPVPMDSATLRKRKAAEEGSKGDTSLTARISPDDLKTAWPFEIEEIASEKSAYIAVIHADGNDLGSTVMRIGDHLKKNPADTARIYRALSEAIEAITVAAVCAAGDAVLFPDLFARRGKDHQAKIAARPIVLGGDDLTIIVRADLADRFTETFLSVFEAGSRTILKEKLGSFNINGLPETLTACAGIAYVKKAYPFAAAYHMAETLCDHTKKVAKADRERRRQGETHVPVPSSFTFHRISTSMAEGFGEVKRKELTGRGRDEEALRFWYGPYAVGELGGNLPQWAGLLELVKVVEKMPKGSVRTLISTMHTDQITAGKEYDRMLQVADKEAGNVFEAALRALTGAGQPLWNDDRQTPLYDAHLLRELRKGGEYAADI